MKFVLAINPGSTSTKVALYEDEILLHEKSLNHETNELEKYETIASQYDFRYSAVLDFLDEVDFDVTNLSAVVGRGGLLPPVKSGAYEVNEAMVDRLMNRPVVEHASNLGGIIAFKIASSIDKKAYIYDSVAVDELDDIARISGMASIERKSFSHCLNMRAVAHEVSEQLNKPYEESNFVVAHLGGGISVSAHKNGKMIDIVSDDEGPFSPERSGRVPCKDLVKACFEKGADKSDMMKKLRGKGGLISYLGTNDARQVEKMIREGDEKAGLVYEAMAYQISKGIGEMAVVLDGQIDGIILTGGMAYSDMLMKWIQKKVSFLSRVFILPGENEMASLAKGTLRVLNGQEKAREYKLG
ncbi:butyrate kinase [Acidaminobacter sp. JC074]|nr:butyrate kinase [Acidaminobacter sp. JC074]